MGVQPPSNDIDDAPDVIEFGIPALDAELPADLSFPVTADHLQMEYGNRTIPIDAAGNEMDLGTALDRCNRDEFENRQDLLNALHPIFEQKRKAASGSILSQLRSLVPF